MRPCECSNATRCSDISAPEDGRTPLVLSPLMGRSLQQHFVTEDAGETHRPHVRFLPPLSTAFQGAQQLANLTVHLFGSFHGVGDFFAENLAATSSQPMDHAF